MRKRAGVERVTPGEMLCYPFLIFTRLGESIDQDDCGVLEFCNVYWTGKRAFVNGQDALRLSVSQINEERQEKYADWGDDEIYVLVGREEMTKKFSWLLLNEEELRDTRSRIEDYSRN
jgi:hypothetical protein